MASQPARSAAAHLAVHRLAVRPSRHASVTAVAAISLRLAAARRPLLTLGPTDCGTAQPRSSRAFAALAARPGGPSRSRTRAVSSACRSSFPSATQLADRAAVHAFSVRLSTLHRHPRVELKGRHLATIGLLRRTYATTSSGVKTMLPSTARPAFEESRHHKRLSKVKDEGYLAFTKASLFKLTLPLQPPSSDPSSPASKWSSPKTTAQAADEQRQHDQYNEPDKNESDDNDRRVSDAKGAGDNISHQPWEQAAETPGPPVSQLNHRPHSQLHGPEQGEPADNEAEEYDAEAPAHSVVFLLHSGQPLSYIASLIRAEGPSPEPSQHQTEAEREQKTDSNDPSSQLAPSPQPAAGSGADARTTFSRQQIQRREAALREGFVDPLGDPPISFHTRAADGKRWSPSTGIGDFLRDAARIGSFIIRIGERSVTVQVPSFEDRTRFMRASLYAKTDQIERLVKIKDECDRIAHTGTRRFALGGVGVLGAWWTSVAWLTFYTELGWDTMEPVTYLTGLGTLMGGYVWFLVHNREVSYRAVLNETTSRRQQKLYIDRGFNVDRYQELIEEVKKLRRSIKRVAEEYDLEWDQGETRVGKEAKRALRIVRLQEAGKDRLSRAKRDEDDQDDHEAVYEDKDGDGQPDHVQHKSKANKKNANASAVDGARGE